MRRFLLVLFALLGATLGLKVTLDSEYVELMGRFNTAASGNVQSEWSYSGYRFWVRPNQTRKVSIQTKMGACATGSSCKYYVQPQIDCVVQPKILVNPDSPVVNLDFSGSHKEVFEIQFNKLTESSNSDAEGTMEIVDIQLEGAEFVPKEMGQHLARQDSHKEHRCAAKKHKMLFLGDSITAAYGVDGDSSSCHFSAETEDITHGYAYLVATAVNAEPQTIAWSGKGVVRNYADPNPISTNPLPTYYNKTIATDDTPFSTTDSNYYNPAGFDADIVSIMLGTNDYSTTPNPSDSDFINGMLDLISRVRVDYPKAGKLNRILVNCAPMQTALQCTNTQKAAEQAGVTYVYLDPSLFSGGYGCDWHPNQATMQNMANVITPVVQKMLGEDVKK